MNASRVHNCSRHRGFSLLEVAIVMVIVAILLTTVGVPLATQVEARRTEETRRMLEEVKEALLGFAMANGRFPCPAFANATSNSAGRESFCVAASGNCPGSETQAVQAHGNCSNFYDGFVPGATLGLSSLDNQGFLVDAWGNESNRVRYAVFGEAVGAGAFPFTSSTSPTDMQLATLSVLGAASSNYLYICNSGTGVTATTCGGGTANTLTTKAPILLMSLAQNAPAGATGADESKNTDGNKVFVSHTPVKGGTNEFDDIVTWIPITTILKKMLDAGKLP
ncbi:MAG: prepilin-type N-terminal cleavage/methylation domain-containing protein [Betaproteobacteria bacterium]